MSDSRYDPNAEEELTLFGGRYLSSVKGFNNQFDFGTSPIVNNAGFNSQTPTHAIPALPAIPRIVSSQVVPTGVAKQITITTASVTNTSLFAPSRKRPTDHNSLNTNQNPNFFNANVINDNQLSTNEGGPVAKQRKIGVSRTVINENLTFGRILNFMRVSNTISELLDRINEVLKAKISDEVSKPSLVRYITDDFYKELHSKAEAIDQVISSKLNKCECTPASIMLLIQSLNPEQIQQLSVPQLNRINIPY